jgi:hypothetical protein
MCRCSDERLHSTGVEKSRGASARYGCGEELERVEQKRVEQECGEQECVEQECAGRGCVTQRGYAGCTYVTVMI